jgi:hypothetical protein
VSNSTAGVKIASGMQIVLLVRENLRLQDSALLPTRAFLICLRVLFRRSFAGNINNIFCVVVKDRSGIYGLTTVGDTDREERQIFPSSVKRTNLIDLFFYLFCSFVFRLLVFLIFLCLFTLYFVFILFFSSFVKG